MQQLEIEHKNEEQEQNRECRGRRLAITANVFRIEKTDSFYCQSENNSQIYYFIRYSEKDAWCSCPDNSVRGKKCKHIYGLEYSMRLATVKHVDKLPTEIPKKVTKSYTEGPTRQESQPLNDTSSSTKEEENRLPTSWKSDQYGY